MMEESREPPGNTGKIMSILPEFVKNSFRSWLPQDSSQIFHLVVLLGFTYAVLCVIQLFWKRQHMVNVLKCFPGPSTHWLYGHVHKMTPEEEFVSARAWTEKYPTCHPVWYGQFLAYLVINHPEYAKVVFSRSDPKSLIVYGFIIPWIGKGLLISDGPKWQKHRKLLTPGFHYDVLKPYLTVMAESVKEMLDILGKLISKDNTASVEIFEHVSLMTLDTIMKCAFSYKSNCQTERDNAYINAVYDLSYLFNQRLKSPLLHNDFIYWLSPQGRRFRNACRLAHLHTDNVIRERKESLKDEQELEKIMKKRRLDFLDILLCARDENGNSLADEDLRAEVDTFMFEGHDTTASGISWLFYCMAQNPEHQQRCREEIRELLGEQEHVQWDDLGKMTYSTMCIKESLRLYPPVPQIARELSTPVTFPDGKTLPKGFLALLGIYNLHRNPEIWENPEVFDPLRFTPENSQRRHPFAFLPFAAGSRNCIGQQFAMNEMKVALALTLLQFELLPDHSNPPIPIPQIVTRSKNGIHLKLKVIN
ncbi:cytochrome P450 4B1-like [Sceloporus undulatus]|uniref:cytochrome P450 4B1-like n=1 Tax=Sceloporus undulatus TaxID=8520 RepID=UPI001C4A96E0|nr:cytochrome P450 4B1-like [Sceloporus undulatus]